MTGFALLRAHDPGWPSSLLDDPKPPACIYVDGEAAALDAPRVAIIGTRRCSSSGREIARELGRELADAGVCVVSGLAYGIDGAAHGGALQGTAPPVAVVGTGLDVIYPPQHRDLWRAVAAKGAVLSEYEPGTPPERWRFPARNRIIAALADVVVVVESHAAGGSLHTVEAALERGRTVMAVPGSVRNPASAGTNALLAAGSPPARDAEDVLVALGLESSVWARRAATTPPTPEGDVGSVLDTIGWEPATLEQIADRLGVPLGPVAVHLLTLVGEGWITQRSGWYERVR